MAGICPNYTNPDFKIWEDFLGNRAEVERIWLVYEGTLPDTTGLSAAKLKDVEYYKTLSPDRQVELENVKLILTNRVSPKILSFDELQTHELLSGFHTYFIPHFLKKNPRGLDNGELFKSYFKSAYVGFLTNLFNNNNKITNQATRTNRAILVTHANKNPTFYEEFFRAYSIYLTNISGAIQVSAEDDEVNMFNTSLLKNEVDKQSNDGAWDKESYKFSTKDSAPAVVKIFLSGIPEVITDKRIVQDAWGKDVLIREQKIKISESFGTALSSDYTRLFNTLATSLSGMESSFTGLMTQLETIINDKSEFRELYNRLNADLNNIDKQNVITQFIQTFSKTKPRFILNLIKEDGAIIFLDTNNQRLNNKYLKEWQNNFIKLSGNEPGWNKSDTASPKRMAQVAEARANANRAIQKVRDLGDKTIQLSQIPDFVGNYNYAMGLLGIHFENDLIYDSNIEIDGKSHRFINYLDNFFKENDLTKELFNKASDVTGRLNNIARQAALFGSEVELQHINAEGETVYGITLNNYITIVTDEINRIVKSSTSKQEREKNLQSFLPHIFLNQYSVINNGKDAVTFNSQLFNLLATGHTLEISILEGIRQDKSGEGGTHFKDMGNADKFTSFLTNTLNKNYSFFRAGDKSTEFGFSIIAPNSTKKVDILHGTNFKVLFHRYLLNEILTSNNLKVKKIGADIENYNQNALSLRIFSEILTGGKNDKLINDEINALISKKNLKVTDIEAFITQYAKTLEDYYEDWMAKTTSETLTFAVENSVFDTYGDNKFLGISSELLEEYKNSKVGVREALIRDFVEKQVVAYIEQTKVFTGDLAQFMRDPKTSNPLADFPKRTGMYTGTKEISRIGDDWDTFKNLVYPRFDQKVLDRSKINTIILKDLYAYFPQIWLDNLKNTFVDKYIKDGYTPKEAESRAEIIVKLYAAKTNFTDGQGFVTLDEYREIRLNNGTWDDKLDEPVYRKLIAGHTGIAELTYFNVLKTQYVGPITDTNGITVMTGYKHSLAPLLPSMTKGKEWEQLEGVIKDKKIGIIQFTSGVKFGVKLQRELSGKYSINDLYINDTEIVNNDFVTQQLDYKYFGIQVQTGSDIHEEVTASSQMNKNILVNNFAYGELANSSLTPAEKEERLKLFQDYNDNLSYLIKTPLNLILQKVEAEVVNGSYNIKNKKKLVDMLLRAASNRNSTDNVLISIEALNRSNAYIDLLHTPGKIGPIVMSKFREGSIDQKRPGSAKIQASNAGFLGYKGEVKDDLLFYEQSKATGETLPIEIEIAFPAKWELLLKNFKSLDDFNGAVQELNDIYREWHNNPENKGKKEPIFKHKGIDIRLLKGVSFRIPHQATASSDLYIIKKFHNPVFGETVLVPRGLTTKVGSDFDVDKFYLYKPNTIVANGTIEYLTRENETNIESELRIRQNELLENQYKILALEDNYTLLMTPIETSVLKKLASKINDAKGKEKVVYYTDMVKPLFNLSLADYFLTGKGNIAIVAKHNSNHSLCQIANIYINNNGDKLDVFFNHNKVTIGGKEYTSLAGIFTQGKDSKEYISEILNQFLSAYVDVAKDPFIFDLNGIKEVIPIILYMTRIGANIDYVAKFVTQPVVIDFIRNKINNKSEIKQMRDQSVSYTKLVSGYFRDNKLSGMDETSNTILSQINRKIHNYKSEEGYQTNEDYQRLVEIKRSIMAKDMLPDIKLGHNFSTAALTKTLADPIKGNIMQGIILQQYLELERQSQFLTEFVNNTDQDTTKFKTVEEAWTKYYKYEGMVNQGFIGNVENLYTKTFMGEFKISQDRIRNLASSLYINSSNFVRNELKNLKSQLIIVNKENRYADKIEQIVNNDFIDYLMQNSSTDELNSKALKYLFDKENPNSIPNRILAIKSNKDHPLNDNIFLMGLIPSYDREGTDANILNFNQRLNTYEENRFSLAFREILARDPKLGEDLIKFAYLQSGSNESNVSWVSKLPSEYINFFKTSLLKETIHNISSQKIKDFTIRFFRRHPELLPRLKMNDEGHLKRSFFQLPPKTYDIFKIDNDTFIASLWDKVNRKFKLLKSYKVVLEGTDKVYFNYEDRARFIIPLLGDPRFYVDYTNSYGEASAPSIVSEDEFGDDESMPTDISDQLKLLVQSESAKPGSATPTLDSLPGKSTVPTMTYAGVGSRETPQVILDKMTEVAKYLESIGYTLQTGFTYRDKTTGRDEEGADRAFSNGATTKTLFGPYNFRRIVDSKTREEKYAPKVAMEASAVVKEVHPAVDRLSPGGMSLMARNTNQIFGEKLDTPVDFVLFYAKETGAVGKTGIKRPEGGTGQAVEIARRKGIPTINMAQGNWQSQLRTVVDELLEKNKNSTQSSTSVEGININTKSSDKLGRELTNPNWGAKNIMDIEAEYKANASKIKAPELTMDEALKYDMNLMYKLQMKKFKAHPELIQEITDRGGVKFLEASEHTVGVKGSRWEGKGINSNFIKVLIKSYEDSLGTTQSSTSVKEGVNLSDSQIAFAKKNTIEQSFFHGKPYQKADNKWDVYKIKNGIKSSIEGALKGFRTQTTRSFTQQEALYKIAENQGLPKGTVKGTIVWMEDTGASPGAKTESPTKGQGGWFKITSEFYTPNKTDFNNFENWEDNVWNDRSSEFKIGTDKEWKSIRFERVTQSSTSTPRIKLATQDIFNQSKVESTWTDYLQVLKEEGISSDLSQADFEKLSNKERENAIWQARNCF